MSYISPEQLAKSAIRSMELTLQLLTQKDRMAIPPREMPAQDPAEIRTEVKMSAHAE